VNAASPRARLDAAVGAVAGERAVVGVGWATVDLDRAAIELASDLGIRPGDFRDASPSVALGARCRVASGALADGDIAVVILEPSTEGRLAGHLARHGEGPAAAWVSAGGSTTSAPSGTATPGPFGPEAALPPAADRPDLLGFLVAREAGTIRA
jgi:hypothetical protein